MDFSNQTAWGAACFLGGVILIVLGREVTWVGYENQRTLKRWETAIRLTLFVAGAGLLVTAPVFYLLGLKAQVASDPNGGTVQAVTGSCALLLGALAVRFVLMFTDPKKLNQMYSQQSQYATVQTLPNGKREYWYKCDLRPGASEDFSHFYIAIEANNVYEANVFVAKALADIERGLAVRSATPQFPDGTL